MSDEQELAPIDPETVLRELQQAARGIDAASAELGRLLMSYEGYDEVDKTTGDTTFHPGTLLRWNDAVNRHLDRIVTAYEDQGKRPPAKEILMMRAEKAARAEDETLWAGYHAQGARIRALQKWISVKRETISARQSILKGVPS